jgi:prepilin-type N-terminal cleavage/methylation domain-containing protein
MMHTRSEKGFTLIEFMIATAVFSTILLVITGAILYMNRSYQKSMYASRTQAATSNLVDTIAQSVRFSSTPIVELAPTSDGTEGFCIGNRQFLYVKYKQLGGETEGSKAQNVFVSRLNDSSTCQAITPIVASVVPGTKELLGRGMRLVNLNIDRSRLPIISITAKVIYGDNESLCDEAVANSCQGSVQLEGNQLKTPNLKCRYGKGSGSEFCAVSELTTTTYQRL